jgi:hypothetical protein
VLPNAHCPCSITCLFKVIRSALTPPLPPFQFSYLFFWKLADRHKWAQPCNRRDLLRSTPFPCSGVDSWLRSWLLDKVSYSQLRYRVPYSMLFFEYSLKAAGKKIHASFVKFMVDKSPYWDIPSTRCICTVKKGQWFSRLQPGCHKPNSPWRGIV